MCEMLAEASCSSAAPPSDQEPPPTRLGPCEVCAMKNARYCCPRCEVKTCSLACNKIHKIEIECNGERDRVRFIPINKFTNLDLASDYRLLEEASRVVEASRKGRVGIRPRLARRYLLLQQQTLKRNVSLKFLPNTFTRHKSNTTWYDREGELVFWHIDWILVNSDSFKISEEKVPENTRISLLLDKYLHKQDNELLQEKLQFYQAAGLPGMKILLKAEQKSGKKFYEIDSTYTLGECLKNKIIIEYPTIHLVLKDQGTFYDIIDSDDDEDCRRELQKQMKSGQEVINKIIKRSESEDNLLESLKNLLFISEYSDEEGDSGPESK